MGLDTTKSNHHIKRMIEEHFLTEKSSEDTKYHYPLSELTTNKATDDIPTSELKPKDTPAIEELDFSYDYFDPTVKPSTSTSEDTMPDDWNTTSEEVDPTETMPNKNDSVSEDFTTVPDKSTRSNYEYPTVSFDSEDSKLTKLFKNIPRD